MKEDKIKKELEEIETMNIEDDHKVSKLIVENEHLKQTYKQLHDLIKSTPLKYALRKLKGKALADDDVTSHSIDLEMLNVDVEPLNPRLLNNRSAHSDFLKHTQEEAVILREIVEQGKSQNSLNAYLDSTCKYTKQIQELLIIIGRTCPSFNNSKETLVVVTPKNKDKRVRFIEPVTPLGNTITNNASSSNLVSNKPALSSTGVKSSTKASGSQPSRNLGNLNLLNLFENLRLSKLWYLDSGCSKHMTGDRSQFTNYINKFLGTVKFKNDHVAKIMGYGDYQIGNVTILRVYYVEGLGHNLFSIGQFCVAVSIAIGFLEGTSVVVVILVKGHAFPTIVKVVQIVLWYLDSGCSKHMTRDRSQLTNFVNKFLGTVKFGNDHLEKIMGYGDYQDVEASKTKFWLWHRRLSHLNFGAINHLAKKGLVQGLPKLKFEKDHLCSACAIGKEAFATACYTQNRSSVRLHHSKTPYELLHDKLPDLSFFYVFGALYYPTNESENLGKLQPKADIDFDELTVVASEQSSLGPVLHEMTPATISSGFVPNPPPSTLFVPSSRTDWDMLFQLLFEELLTPPPSVYHQAPEVIAPIAAVVAPEPATSTGSPSVTTVDQDVQSPSNSQTTPKTQSPIIPNDVEEVNHDLDIVYMNNKPFFGLVPNTPPLTLFVPPSRTNWDILFQPLFDELLTPSPSVNHPAPEFIALIAKVVALEPAASTGSPSSTTVD
nr:hypothetical protein [Tanacetum cinerariifolium]